MIGKMLNRFSKYYYQNLKAKNFIKIPTSRYSKDSSTNENENKRLHIPVMVDQVVKYLVNDVKSFKVINLDIIIYTCS